MGAPVATTCFWLHISGILTRPSLRYGFVFSSGSLASMFAWPGQA